MPLPGRGRKKDSDRKNGRRRRVDIQRTGLAVATIVVLSLLLCIHLLPDRVSLAPGDIAPEDITANRSVRYLDTYEFHRRQAEAATQVDKVYDRVPYALDQSLHELNRMFDAIASVRGDPKLPTMELKSAHARELIKSQLGMEIPFQSALVLVRAPESVLRDVQNATASLVRETMSGELHDDVMEMPKVGARLAGAAENALGTTKYAAAAAELAKAAVRPNMIFNYEKTAAERERAIGAVKPVYGYVHRGELVIAKGQLVAREHVEKLTALGLRQRPIDYRTVALLSALVAFFVLLVILYLSMYQPAIYSRTRLLLMLSLVAAVSVFGLKLARGMIGINLSGLQLAYIGLIFTTTAGMVLAALLNPQIAVLIVAMLSILSGLVMNNELRYATSTLISGLVAIYAVANIRGRGDLMRALGAIALTNLAVVWIMGGLSGDALADMVSGSVWAVVVIAPAAATLFWYGTWLLERPFRLTTHISLLELADTNSPILRRLVVEAPGTYTHSMAVGHLAEAAADAIGADSLFVRVASYYHDIGKIRRPHFFVENQRVENVHDRLNPTLSALVITSHIKDGLEVARDFRLPPSIEEVILQHHGTSLVQYFYNQASEQVEPSPVLEQQFRYDGPKPQSREAAIVMLADSVEAGSRSLAKPTPPTLEVLVHKIVSEKLQDGQLDESELTFRDIGIIEDTFARTLCGTLHARIEYPEGVSAEDGKLADDGDIDQELAAASGGPQEAPENRGEAAEG